MTYDTIIIGAGLSGLAAGIRLTYYEKKVCLLERHTTIGGLNSFYRLRGKHFDVGLHAVTNYAPPGTKTGPLSKLLRQLRLGWEDFGLVPQNGSSVEFPGCRLDFSNEFAEFAAQIDSRFPDQADRFRQLVERIRTHDEVNLNRAPLSARQVVGEYLTDPLLIDMIFCPLMFYGSATPHDMDFSQFVIMFKSIFFEGFGRPHAGVHQILKTLVRRFKELGGTLKLRAGVKAIHSSGTRATSVELEDGTIIEGRNVLSSAGSAETMALCRNAASGSANEASPAPQQHEPGAISFVETIFVLSKPPAELGHTRTIVFYSDRPDFRYDCPPGAIDLDSGIICSPNNFAYESPLELNKIRITALANPSIWMNLPQEEYVEQKRQASAAIVAAAVKHIPDFRPHIIDEDMFTPRTIVKYTGHLNGAVYGAPRKVVDGRTHLDNLFLCGTDQGFLGIIGAMLSGISMANAYLLK